MKKTILILLFFLTSCTSVSNISNYQKVENLLNNSMLQTYQGLPNDGDINNSSLSIEGMSDEQFMLQFNKLPSDRAVALLKYYKNEFDKLENKISESPYPEYDTQYEKLNKIYEKYYSILFKKINEKIKKQIFNLDKLYSDNLEKNIFFNNYDSNLGINNEVIIDKINYSWQRLLEEFELFKKEENNYKNNFVITKIGREKNKDFNDLKKTIEETVSKLNEDAKLIFSHISPWNFYRFSKYPTKVNLEFYKFSNESIYSVLKDSESGEEVLEDFQEYKDKIKYNEINLPLTNLQEKDLIKKIYEKYYKSKNKDNDIFEEFLNKSKFQNLLLKYNIDTKLFNNNFPKNFKVYYVDNKAVNTKALFEVKDSMTTNMDNNREIIWRDTGYKREITRDIIQIPTKPINININDLSEEITKLKQNNINYILLLSIVQEKFEREKLSNNELQSKYLQRIDRNYNPEYDIARNALSRCNSNYQQEMYRADRYCEGNQGGFWGGFACGYTQNSMRNRAKKSLKKCEDRLKNTPQYIENKIYENYNYNLRKYKIKKDLKLKTVLISLKNNKYKEIIDNYSLNEEFSIPYNLNNKDPNKNKIINKYDKEKDIEKFEQSSVKYRLNDYFNQLINKEYDKNFKVEKYLTSFKSEDTQTSFAKEENASIQKIGYNENQFTSVVVIKSPKGSLGTGFYISENIIITNQHVVEGSNFIDLELRDGSESFGKVIKSDPDLDLALVRVEKKGKPIVLANKYDINIGERADAIGHPRGLTFSITRGIVSAVRTMGGIKYIQTDASISPGNSGGPLYQNKKVIGINTWKRADNLSEGLGFAIHIDEIQKFISDL